MKLTLPNVPGYSRICHAIEIDLIEAFGGKPEQLEDAAKNCDREH
jgi:hypothetical protein